MYAFLLVLSLWGQCEDTSLPLVEEWVDEIAIIYRCEINDEYPLVLFIRHGRLLADRAHSDSMLLLVNEDTFTLQWQDYWTAERVVHTKRLGVYVLKPLEHDPNGGEWWQMARRMTDLKAP